MKKYILFALSALVLSGCSKEKMTLDIPGMFWGSSPEIDTRIEDSFRYNDQHGYPVIQAADETYNVYVGTDSHVSFTRRNWVRFISDYRSDAACPLAIHLGDMIDAQNHWDYMAGAVDSVPKNPYKQDTLLAIAGNHDLYFNQWSEYTKRYGTSTYYAIVRTPMGKKDLFIFLDTAEGTLGAKQQDWLERLLKWADGQSFRHIVACTHTCVFKRDASQGHTSNMTLEETYHLLNMLQNHHVEFFLQGHDHSREVSQYREMTSIIIDALKDTEKGQAYMVMQMSDAAIGYNFVSLVQ